MARNKGAFVNQTVQQMNQGFQKITRQLEIDLWKGLREERLMNDFINHCKQVTREKK